ncbi:MAG: SsrA-binding protein SmpB [Candidatus Phytoplasma stylosanthis]|uniref:SsrA-binding protein SmpB n=1 Tax=Candidatus Phytoplasma stylosanthis TaxID=2798314 RepID=UPI00293A8CBE|nr:SsrA-binding protein SmpB [Candidatus Phytoplasma stylosanthis]MDV3168171.1 SsrA-binding protein SmpB [Candidatus Phytoplasma stylosanthis]MDV3171087.1 SsrA-binding protein SmpB [Candidatus Phytoplasma stylosanthis]MDV3174376.1 SsrA-binding protein SmpB [Candidatus Phytoplasma stylosanthis]MDV3202469.1 SsrA-binding protein SmpB [Candidatus Phytoplasma stylosanthis]
MIKTILTNKKAFYNYFLEKKYIAGIQLLGNEVKSIRLKKVNFDNSYINIENNEAFVFNMFIFKYDFSNKFDYEEKRKKKLLLKKKEILQIKNKIQIKDFSAIPVKIISDRNLLKLEIYLAKGKKKYDKRNLLKEKDDQLRIKKSLECIY